MAKLSLSDLATLSGFKAFLQHYHQQLTQDRAFPPLGLGKALHTASAVFGSKNWHVLSSQLQRETSPEAIGTAFYTLIHNERSRGSDSSAVPTVHRTLEACLDHLMAYVVPRLREVFTGELVYEFADLLADAGYDMSSFDWQDIDTLTERLSRHQQAQIVEWYFDFADDELVRAYFDIQFHRSPDDTTGRSISLADAFSESHPAAPQRHEDRQP